MKSIILFFRLLSFTARSQFLIPSVEPLFGLNAFKSTDHAYSPIAYSGISFYYGLRAKCMIGNRISIGASAGVKSYPFDQDLYVNSTIQGFVHRNYETGFSVFCESGVEMSSWGDLTIPFYVGTSQYFGQAVSFNFRLRLPTFIDIAYLKTAGHMEVGVEAGLQFDIVKRKKKDITSFGNPFILE